jgi:hypothetical protein
MLYKRNLNLTEPQNVMINDINSFRVRHAVCLLAACASLPRLLYSFNPQETGLGTRKVGVTKSKLASLSELMPR